jgi:hypothetical protein
MTIVDLTGEQAAPTVQAPPPRTLRIGPTSIGSGATMGPISAVLPDTKLGAGTCIGGHSPAFAASSFRLPLAGTVRQS